MNLYCNFLKLTNKHKNSGFTLIEVMIALAIVAISLGSAIAITSQDIMRADSMQHRAYANWIAQNKLTEARINNIKPNVGIQDGFIIFAGNNWQWETNISETGIDDLYRMDVAVSIEYRELPARTITGFINDNSKIRNNVSN
jgi:general secretion pathway protein I|tara:strand:+ start:9331 stop:9756 length:426 start_codon:yes stop_codon:yes gene_type:complete